MLYLKGSVCRFLTVLALPLVKLVTFGVESKKLLEVEKKKFNLGVLSKIKSSKPQCWRFGVLRACSLSWSRENFSSIQKRKRVMSNPRSLTAAKRRWKSK